MFYDGVNEELWLWAMIYNNSKRKRGMNYDNR